MGARLRAAHDQALTTGWYAEVFARTKELKPLPEYLDRRTDEERASGDARKLIAMFQRLHDKQKQEAAGGTG